MVSDVVLCVCTVIVVGTVMVVEGMVSNVVLSVGAVTVVGTVMVVEEMVSDVVLSVGAVTVVGTVMVVEEMVSDVVLSVSAVTVVGTVRAVEGVVSAGVRGGGTVIVVVGMTIVVVLTAIVVGIPWCLAPDAPAETASASVTSPTSARNPPGPFILDGFARVGARSAYTRGTCTAPPECRQSRPWFAEHSPRGLRVVCATCRLP